MSLDSVRELLASLGLKERILEDFSENLQNGRLFLEGGDLNLNEKIAIEKKIWAKLGGEVQVVFLSKKMESSGSIPRPWEKDVPQPAPFGLSLQKKAIPGVKYVVPVVSGKGGVGKSTLSVNLALSFLDMGYQVGYLDADVYGPSGSWLLGHPQTSLSCDSRGRLIPPKLLGLSAMSLSFLMGQEEPLLWRGPLISKALKQLFYEVCWPSLDILVVDLPPGTGDIHMTLLENIPLQGVVLVSTPQRLALADTVRATSMARRMGIPIFGLIGNMVGILCENCETYHYPLGNDHHLKAFCDREKLCYLGSIPLVSQIAEACDESQRPVFLGDILKPMARKVVESLNLVSLGKDREASSSPHTS